METDNTDFILKPFSLVTEPGAMPGTVVAVPDEPKPEIHVLAYSNGDMFDETVNSTTNLKEIVDKYSVTWINVEGLGDASVIQRIGEVFGFHRLALEDVVNIHQRPKIDDYGDYLFIVARMIDQREKLQSEQIAFFVGENYVITFQEGKPGDCLDPIRNRLRKASGKIRKQGADYLAYALIDSIIDHYFPLVDTYGERLDELDDEVMNNRNESSIAAIHGFRSELLVLRRAIRPHREVLNQLLRCTNDLIRDETRIFLRDCYDHTIQLSEAIDTYREVCSDLRDFHLSAVSSRTNDVMKTLTIIATIFIPLSFIAGLYGMNFDEMPELHWKYGYIFALSMMAIVAGGLLYWFRRKGWFVG